MYKVAYATGSRADYGIVTRYLKKLNEDPEIHLDILVTGSHLEDKYGKSISQIEADGFNVVYKCPIDLSGNDNSGIINSMSIAMSKFGDYFAKNKYDLLIILGDRYEMFAVATAAAMNRQPILHLHGGEVTYGNYDEFIRHSITKMSTYHFTSTLKYRNRVIQLGENPDRVFYLGALGAENCLSIDEDKVKNKIRQLPEKQYVLVAFHPETITGVSSLEQVNELIGALSIIIKKYSVVLMGSNADTGSEEIRKAILEFDSKYENSIYIENVNVDSYLYMMKKSLCIIGNSSSGIIEAPSLNTFTINIGDRQAGRERANSIKDVRCNTEEIIDALAWVEKENENDNRIDNPYYKKNASEEYYSRTKVILNGKTNVVKEFFDVDFML